MTSIRVSREFLDRVKEEQDVEETVEETLRYLLGWTEDEDDEDDDQDQDDQEDAEDAEEE